MNKDKKIIYLTSSLSIAVLLVALFTVKSNGRLITACLLAMITPAVCLLIKKRSSASIAKKEVLAVMSLLAVLIAVATEFSGIYFGYAKNPYFVNPSILLNHVIPTAVVIITVEFIRHALISQKNRFADFSAFVIGVLAEVIAFSGVAGIQNFNHFMNLIGMTLFPAITANLFYNYISKRYGAMPNVAYRIILTLYSYFLAQTTAMGDALAACIKIITPIIISMFIAALFAKRKKNAIKKGGKLSLIGSALAFSIIVAVAILISCQFRFGAIVIATESMTGEINKGDMIIYERYDDQPIKEGQVIVFKHNENKIIHRVIRIENLENEVRYYTKGDANMDEDIGYRTESDIIGLTDVKLSFVGYPTLWLRELLSGSN